MLALTHLALALTLSFSFLSVGTDSSGVSTDSSGVGADSSGVGADSSSLLALTLLALALARLVLVLVRWLLALDSQAQQMVAKDGTPESTALPRQRAQWSQQSIAEASRSRELDRIWRADPVLLFLILICAPTQLHVTRIKLHTISTGERWANNLRA